MFLKHALDGRCDASCLVCKDSRDPEPTVAFHSSCAVGASRSQIGFTFYGFIPQNMLYLTRSGTRPPGAGPGRLPLSRNVPMGCGLRSLARSSALCTDGKRR